MRKCDVCGCDVLFENKSTVSTCGHTIRIEDTKSKEREEKINRGLNRIAFALMLERTEDIYQSVEAIRMGLLVLCIGGMAICIKRILTNG